MMSFSAGCCSVFAVSAFPVSADFSSCLGRGLDRLVDSVFGWSLSTPAATAQISPPIIPSRNKSLKSTNFRSTAIQMLLQIVVESNSEQARQTALRLIFEKGKWDGLPWLIRAAGQRTPSVSAKSRSFIEAWFTPPLWTMTLPLPPPGYAYCTRLRNIA